jgi:hypothetical protein
VCGNDLRELSLFLYSLKSSQGSPLLLFSISLSNLYREQWKGYVAPYQPVFMDGWSPTIRDTSSSSSAIGVVAAEAAMRRLQAQQEVSKVNTFLIKTNIYSSSL